MSTKHKMFLKVIFCFIIISTVLCINIELSNGVICSVSQSLSSTLSCNELEEVESRIYRLINPDDYLKECSEQCASRKEQGLICVGFIFRNHNFGLTRLRNTCVFSTCTKILETKNDNVVAVLMENSCSSSNTFTPSSSPVKLPSKSPRFRVTDSPKSVITDSPKSSITDSPKSVITDSPHAPAPFRSPTGILESAPFNRALFEKITLDTNVCMIARPASSLLSVTFTSFFGTENDCMKECQWDDYCTAVLYSSTLNICVKTYRIERTDDTKAAAEFYRNWQVFKRINSPIPYYAQACALHVHENACRSNGGFECAWMMGERGYNQLRYTDTGYCGRISCNYEN